MYSYLLSLEKHTRREVLLYRLARIIFVSLICLGIHPRTALVKLRGVWQYLSQKRNAKID